MPHVGAAFNAGQITADHMGKLSECIDRCFDALVSMAMRSAIVDGEAALPEPMVYVHTSPADIAEALEADAGLAPGR